MIVLATKNLGKVAEFERLIGKLTENLSDNSTGDNFKVLGLNDFPQMPDVAETGSTLEENAYLKATAIAKFTKLPCLADDSGLFITALNDQPGVYSARFASDKFSDSTQDEIKLFATDPARANINKVLRKLDQKTDRSAQFRTVVAFIDLQRNHRFDFKGVLDGRISTAAVGENGFGYDPIFIPDQDLPGSSNSAKTLAQLTGAEKDAISHRARAFAKALPVITAALKV